MVQTREGPVSKTRDWRDKTAYQYACNLPRIGWAWEFLRRNPKFRKVAREGRKPGRIASVDARTRVVTPAPAPHLAEWGLFFFDDLNRTARDATVLWRLEDCALVLSVAASPLSAGSDHEQRFSVDKLDCRKTVVVEPDGRQHILFSDGRGSIQIEVEGTSLLDGDVILTAVPIALNRRADSQIIALQRLRALQKLGRLSKSLFVSRRRDQRLHIVLQMLDAWLAKASHRQIAEYFHGVEVVAAHWHEPDNPFKDRTRKAVYRGLDLMNGGYRSFLR